MEIQTRRHILEIWRATVDYSYRDGKWNWGGRSGRNSISDAEQLLTILYPATAIESLKRGQRRRDGGRRPRLPALAGQRDGHPAAADRVHRTSTCAPTWSTGRPTSPGTPTSRRRRTGRRAVKDEQRQLHVVDSYSMSVTLCLATLGFLRVYRQGLRSQRRCSKRSTSSSSCARSG